MGGRHRSLAPLAAPSGILTPGATPSSPQWAATPPSLTPSSLTPSSSAANLSCVTADQSSKLGCSPDPGWPSALLAMRDKQVSEQSSRCALLSRKMVRKHDEVEALQAQLKQRSQQTAKALRRKRQVIVAHRSSQAEVKALRAAAAAAEEQTEALREHLHKLTVALSLEARARAAAEERNAALTRRLRREKERTALLKERARHADKAVVHLKAQADMLAGQLHLADLRYADTRGKLEQERLGRRRRNKGAL